MRVEVVQGSIADADADVLVNASNTILRLGSGVSAAIGMSCGAGLRDELSRLRAARPQGWEPGAVIVTSAGDHPRAKYVAHVAVMDYRDIPGARARPDLARIRVGCEALWDALEGLERDHLSVAMVALGAGTGGLGLRDSVRTACETLRGHLRAAGDTGRPTRIDKTIFVAYALHDLINTAVVVRDYFSLSLDAFGADARRLIELG